MADAEGVFQNLVPWTVLPPAGQPIDLSLDILRGVYWFFNLNGSTRDLVRGITRGAFAGGATFQRDGVFFPRGTGDGNGQRINLNDKGEPEQLTADQLANFTIFSVFRFGGGSNANEYPIISNRNPGAGTNRGVITVSSTLPDDLQPHTVAGVWSEASADNLNKFYEEGLETATATPTGDNINGLRLRYDADVNQWEFNCTDNDVTSDFYIGGTPEKDLDTWRGDINLIVLWLRVLPAEEIFWLHNNWRQLFQPLAEPIPPVGTSVTTSLIPMEMPYVRQIPDNYTPIDQSNAFGKRVVLAFVPGWGAPGAEDRIIRSIGRQEPLFMKGDHYATSDSGDAVLRPGRTFSRGPTLRHNVASNDLSEGFRFVTKPQGLPNTPFADLQKLTVLCICEPFGTGVPTTTGQVAMFSRDLGNSGPNFDFLLGQEAADDGVFVRLRTVVDGTVTVSITAVSLLDDKLNLVAVTYDGVNVKAHILTEDGAYATVSGAATGNYDERTSSMWMSIGARAHDSSEKRSFVGAVHVAMCLDGVMDEAQLRRFFNNWTQVFEPQQIFLPTEFPALIEEGFIIEEVPWA